MPVGRRHFKAPDTRLTQRSPSQRRIPAFVLPCVLTPQTAVYGFKGPRCDCTKGPSQLPTKLSRTWRQGQDSMDFRLVRAGSVLVQRNAASQHGGPPSPGPCPHQRLFPPRSPCGELLLLRKCCAVNPPLCLCSGLRLRTQLLGPTPACSKQPELARAPRAAWSLRQENSRTSRNVRTASGVPIKTGTRGPASSPMNK